jgi:hypothetical protein
MVPAASFAAKSGRSYKCSKAAAAEVGPVTAATGLDECVFSVSIKGITLGDVEFGINFNGFNEMAT